MLFRSLSGFQSNHIPLTSFWAENRFSRSGVVATYFENAKNCEIVIFLKTLLKEASFEFLMSELFS